MTSSPRWSTRAVWFHPAPANYFTVVWTTRPVHLTLYALEKEPTGRIITASHRGSPEFTYREFASITRGETEQEEPGDTYWHTFLDHDNLAEENPIIRFAGTINAIPSLSRSPGFVRVRPGNPARNLAVPATNMTQMRQAWPSQNFYPMEHYHSAATLGPPDPNIYRSVVSFLPAYTPPGATLRRASALLHQTDHIIGFYEGQTHAHVVTTPWQQETATWNFPWTTPGGDFNPASFITHTWIGATVLYQPALTTLIAEQLQTYGITRLLIKQPDETDLYFRNQIGIFSNVAPIPHLQPLLLLEFR